MSCDKNTDLYRIIGSSHSFNIRFCGIYFPGIGGGLARGSLSVEIAFAESAVALK